MSIYKANYPGGQVTIKIVSNTVTIDGDEITIYRGTAIGFGLLAAGETEEQVYNALASELLAMQIESPAN